MNPWAIALPSAALAAGVGVGIWAAASPASQLYGPTLRHLLAHGSVRQIALTFDDGPNPSVTPQLLNLLDRHQAKATFFVVGRFARACPN